MLKVSGGIVFKLFPRSAARNPMAAKNKGRKFEKRKAHLSRFIL